MKNLTSILSTLILLFMFSCGGGSSSTSEEKSGIYEPKTQEEFVQILDDLGIKPYPGSTITSFKEGANSEMSYEVTSEGNSNKAITEYYTDALAKALQDKPEWKKFMTTPISVIYMKGYDLTFTMSITSENATMEMAGDAENVPEKLSYMISLGDDSVSY